MKLSNVVLDILGECKVEENILYLPDRQLERADYMAVNKVLEELGGKWNRKSKGHIFDHCPEDEIETVILTGEITDKKKEFQNNKFKIERYTKKLNELEHIREIVESNVKVEYLEMLEVFRLTTNESIEQFGILRHNLFKLKNEIREEFYKVLDMVEAE